VAEQDRAQERTEEATPKRRREARAKGQVARSRELTTFLVMLAGATTLLLAGGLMARQLAGVFRSALQPGRAGLFDAQAMLAVFAAGVEAGLWALAPLFLVVAAAAFLAPLALGGWVFSPQALGFKWDKLDPIKGLKRIFSSRGLMELVKALAKFALVSAVAVWLGWGMLDRLLGLGAAALGPALEAAARLVGWSLLWLSLALVVIAAVDVPFQLWNHARQLRMTRQELRDEFKETEGRPEVKNRIRELQRALAQRRMMAEVPKADVVVTNPGHYAVALRYHRDQAGAPRVVAKGVDRVALRIREVAEAHGVPRVAAPPLARALYYSTELEREIPAGLYVAVAQVLAYVYSLREGGEVPPPRDLPIPEDLRR